MTRLPIVGADKDNWGALLNEFLQVAHRADGALRGVAEVINVRDYGATGNGQTNDLAAVQAAIQAAAPGSVLYFPSGDYLLKRVFILKEIPEENVPLPQKCKELILQDDKEVLLINKLLHLRGTGAATTLLKGEIEIRDPNNALIADCASFIDIIHIDIQGETRFMSIENLQIRPKAKCRHTINIDVNQRDPLQVQANLLIQDCFLLSSGDGYAIYLTNSHSDGFFASHINRNFVLGGIYLNCSGDSIWITHNLISDTPGTGTNTGITLKNDVGAVSSVIAYNNITAYGGAINIIRGGETKILYNQLEARPPYHIGVRNALLSIEGDADKPGQCFQIDIVGNNINPNQTVDYAIYLGYASEIVIENNHLVGGKPGVNDKQRHIKIESYTKDTRIGFNTWADGKTYERIEPEIEDASNTTIHMYTRDGTFNLLSKTLRLNPVGGSVEIAGLTATIGFFGASPVPQQGHIAAPTGGATVDTEVRAALAQILSTLEAYGLIE